MKNTKSGRIQFGKKAYVKVFSDSNGGTGIAASCQIEIKTVKENKILSRKMVNFDDIRKKEAYSRINAKFGEG